VSISYRHELTLDTFASYFVRSRVFKELSCLCLSLDSVSEQHARIGEYVLHVANGYNFTHLDASLGARPLDR
jgi:hypothetical protein